MLFICGKECSVICVFGHTILHEQRVNHFDGVNTLAPHRGNNVCLILGESDTRPPTVLTSSIVGLTSFGFCD